MIPVDRVQAARERLRPWLGPTPLLSLRADLALKLESLHPTASFKVRGFFAAVTALAPAEREAGLITVSAGNAALAAAYVARAFGVPCRVYMYDTAARPKLEGVRRLGAEPVLLPRPELLRFLAGRGWESEPGVFVHPFADEELAAGHGTCALELLEQVPQLARVLVPVGGGGLAWGLGSALKQLRPDARVLGCQSDGYPLWPRALTAGTDPRLVPETIADGTTAPFQPEMMDRLREVVDDWVVVPEPRLRAAIGELAAAGKVVAEGAGALAFAALEQLDPQPGTVAIVSGGNIDPRLLAELIQT